MVLSTALGGEEGHYGDRCTLETNMCLFKWSPEEHLKFLGDGMIFEVGDLMSKKMGFIPRENGKLSQMEAG